MDGWELAWCREDGITPSLDAVFWFSDDRAVVHCLAGGNVVRYVEIELATGLRRRDEEVDGAGIVRRPWSRRPMLIVATSLDDGTALIGTSEGQVVLLDVCGSSARLTLLLVVSGEVLGIEVAGERILVATTREVRVWERASLGKAEGRNLDAQRVATLSPYGQRGVALSPDGRRVAYIAWRAGRRMLVIEPSLRGDDAASIELPTHSTWNALAFDADEQHLWLAESGGGLYRCALAPHATVTPVATRGRVRGLFTGQVAGEVLVHDSGLTCVRADGSPPRSVVAPDSRRTVPSRDGRRALLLQGHALQGFDAASGERSFFVAHDGPVRGVAWSIDGALVASGSVDGVRVWSADDGRLLWHLEGHDDPVHAVGFAPDRARLYSSSARGVVKAWDLSRGLEVASLQLPSEVDPVRVGGMRVAPDGDSLCVLGGEVRGPVYEVDVASWSLRMDGRPVEVACDELRYTPAAGIAALHSPPQAEEPTLRWWQMAHGGRSESGDYDAFSEFRVARSRSRIVLSPDCAAMIWMHDETTPRFSVRAFPSGECLRSVKIGPPRVTRHLALGRRRVVAALAYDKLWSWDLDAMGPEWILSEGAGPRFLSAEGVMFRTALPCADEVTSLALSPDESRVLVGTERGALYCWRIP